MFRITEHPSSGSLVQCLAKNYKNDSVVSVDMDKVGVMAAYSDPQNMLQHHPHRTHDLRSGSHDHHPPKNSVQKTICCNSTSNAPDDGRMPP
jgi:hypothetical protein